VFPTVNAESKQLQSGVQERLPPEGLQNDSEVCFSSLSSSFLNELLLVLCGGGILSISTVSPPAERSDRNCCSVSTSWHLQGHPLEHCHLWCHSLHHLHFVLIFILMEAWSVGCSETVQKKSTGVFVFFTFMPSWIFTLVNYWPPQCNSKHTLMGIEGLSLLSAPSGLFIQQFSGLSLICSKVLEVIHLFFTAP